MQSAFDRFLWCSVLTLVSLSIFFYSSPLLAEPNESGIDHELGIYYTSQKGDTLPFISERFFDSVTYWPELWKDNPQIRNPHEIAPGEKIRLFHQTGTKRIPKSLLAGKYLAEPESAYTIFSPVNAAGFIKSGPVKILGSIFKATGEKEIISEGDEVFFWRNDSGSFEAGTRCTILRIIQVPEKNNMSNLGLRYQMTGIVEIRDVKPDYCSGIIYRSYRKIRIGDLLMPYTERSRKIPLDITPKGISGRIVAAEDDKEIMGDGDVAFIDKGRRDGLLPGQQFLLFDHDKRVNPATAQEVSVGPLDFGTILVLIAEENASTVVITQADKKVVVGDRFRTASLMD
ncbi:MAG: LysM peptidoglycan-binding domain-containing protein [Thermodesulfobacteriota bacterium]